MWMEGETYPFSECAALATWKSDPRDSHPMVTWIPKVAIATLGGHVVLCGDGQPCLSGRDPNNRLMMKNRMYARYGEESPYMYLDVVGE